MKGYVQVYTGNGKGKTTAAFGQALRGLGAGFTVFIGQFVKGKTYHENIATTKYLKNITVKQYGLGCFIVDAPTDKDIETAKNGLEEMKKIIHSGEYDMVVMDEVNIALYYNLIDIDDVLDLMKSKPEQLELILTGRYAPIEVIEMADLVTMMKEIKHPYQQGIIARKGIEY
jgi:cob(I)alamin adenosyltransferase